jgi:hypothetical protein
MLTHEQPKVRSASPSSGPGWFQRHWIGIIAAALGFVGIGIGASAADNQDSIDQRAADIKALQSEMAALRKLIDGPSVQRTADDGRLKAVAEERRIARAKEAAQKRAAAAEEATETGRAP